MDGAVRRDADEIVRQIRSADYDLARETLLGSGTAQLAAVSKLVGSQTVGSRFIVMNAILGAIGKTPPGDADSEGSSAGASSGGNSATTWMTHNGVVHHPPYKNSGLLHPKAKENDSADPWVLQAATSMAHLRRDVDLRKNRDRVKSVPPSTQTIPLHDPDIPDVSPMYVVDSRATETSTEHRTLKDMMSTFLMSCGQKVAPACNSAGEIITFKHPLWIVPLFLAVNSEIRAEFSPHGVLGLTVVVVFEADCRVGWMISLKSCNKLFSFKLSERFARAVWSGRRAVRMQTMEDGDVADQHTVTGIWWVLPRDVTSPRGNSAIAQRSHVLTARALLLQCSRICSRYEESKARFLESVREPHATRRGYVYCGQPSSWHDEQEEKFRMLYRNISAAIDVVGPGAKVAYAVLGSKEGESRVAYNERKHQHNVLMECKKDLEALEGLVAAAGGAITISNRAEEAAGGVVVQTSQTGYCCADAVHFLSHHAEQQSRWVSDDRVPSSDCFRVALAGDDEGQASVFEASMFLLPFGMCLVPRDLACNEAGVLASRNALLLISVQIRVRAGLEVNETAHFIGYVSERCCPKSPEARGMLYCNVLGTKPVYISDSDRDGTQRSARAAIHRLWEDLEVESFKMTRVHEMLSCSARDAEQRERREMMCCKRKLAAAELHRDGGASNRTKRNNARRKRARERKQPAAGAAVDGEPGGH